MHDPKSLVDRMGGIATRRQLIAAGCSGTDLTRAVRLGEIRRVRQARYATASAVPSALVAARVGGMIAGPTAARSYGLWGGTDPRIHISVGDNSSRLRTIRSSFADGDLTVDNRPVPVVVHWLKGGATPELGPECWRVPIDDCLRQVAEWCDSETALACLDTALNATSLTGDDLERIFRRSPAGHRLLASRARPGSGSGLESIVRQRLAAAGIGVRQQVQIRGVGRVDMVIAGSMVVVEADGELYHATAAAFEEDRRRDAELVALGFRVIRLSYRRVLEDWPWCLRKVQEALSSFRTRRDP